MKIKEVIDDLLELIWGKEYKRARNEKGRFVANDKYTMDVNEAWVGGKAPNKDKE